MAKAPTDIRSLARTHTNLAVNTLAKITRDSEAPHSARVAAANSLLDRGWGKSEANVTINHKRDALDYSRTDLAAILAEPDAPNGGAGTAETDGRDGTPDSVH